jgi:hypothetical protein
MQFINIAVVIILVNFNIFDGSGEESKFIQEIPVLNGDFKDFTVEWYFRIGATLCITLAINIFSPHFTKIMISVYRQCLRCKDRSWKYGYKLADDKINTRKELQSEIQNLYTGPQI